MRSAHDIRQRSEDPQKVKERSARYYQKNRAKLTEANKQWQIDNRERANQIGKDSYNRHKEERVAARKEYQSKAKDKLKEYAYSYSRTEKSQRRRKDYNLRVTFGITLEDYERMFNEQQGKCYLCHKHQLELKMRLAVDHNHDTGKVRKLLCNHCNLGIGQLSHDPELLKRAVAYLEEHV